MTESRFCPWVGYSFLFGHFNGVMVCTDCLFTKEIVNFPCFVYKISLGITLLTNCWQNSVKKLKEVLVGHIFVVVCVAGFQQVRRTALSQIRVSLKESTLTVANSRPGRTDLRRPVCLRKILALAVRTLGVRGNVGGGALVRDVHHAGAATVFPGAGGGWRVSRELSGVDSPDLLTLAAGIQASALWARYGWPARSNRHAHDPPSVTPLRDELGSTLVVVVPLGARFAGTQQRRLDDAASLAQLPPPSVTQVLGQRHFR